MEAPLPIAVPQKKFSKVGIILIIVLATPLMVLTTSTLMIWFFNGEGQAVLSPDDKWQVYVYAARRRGEIRLSSITLREASTGRELLNLVLSPSYKVRLGPRGNLGMIRWSADSRSCGIYIDEGKTISVTGQLVANERPLLSIYTPSDE